MAVLDATGHSTAGYDAGLVLNGAARGTTTFGFASCLATDSILLQPPVFFEALFDLNKLQDEPGEEVCIQVDGRCSNLLCFSISMMLFSTCSPQS